MPLFFKNVIIIGISNILNKITIPIISLLLSISFSENKYGAWTIYITLIPLIVFTLDFGLTKSFQRFYFDNLDKNKKNFFLINYLYLRIIIYFIILCVSSITLFFFWEITSLNYFKKFPFLIIVLLISLAESHLTFVISFLRLEKYLNIILSIRFIQFSLTIFSAFFLSKYYGITGAIFGFSFSIIFLSILLTIFFLINYKNFIYRNFRFIKLRQMTPIVKYSIPFFINDLCYTVRNISLPFILSIFFPLAVVGNFHISMLFASILFLFIISVDMIISPNYLEFRVKNIKQKLKTDKIIKTVSNLIICIISIFTIIFFTFVTSLFELLFPTKDVVNMKILLILSVGFYFQAFYIMWVKPCLFTKNNNFIPIISFFITLIMIGNIYFLTPKYGILVPAIMSLFSQICYAFLILLISKNYETIGLEFLIYIPSIIFVSLSSFISYLFITGKISIVYFVLIIITLILSTTLSLIVPKYSRIKYFLIKYNIFNNK